ncbi:hypothetical protein [Acinetobacter sp.]|uniref:hypothetical protein n=1 Tax=Acinetobacter sp. TaxID=472 RepID=UPI003CFD6476
MDIQAYINDMSALLQRERAGTQMTLGGLIERLGELPPEKEIKGLGDLGSYRGYYMDLAFEPSNETETASALLERCKDAIGQVFKGYKGGDFVMGAMTPLWIANYGSMGDKIMNIKDNGYIEVASDI